MKVDVTTGSRDHMHFESTESTIAVATQMIYDALRRTRAASPIRHEVGRAMMKLKTESGRVSAPRSREATFTSSGGEPDHYERDARLRIPPRVGFEQALISSAAEEVEANHIAICKSERAGKGITAR